MRRKPGSNLSASLLLGLMIVALAGCLQFERGEYPEKRTYALDVARPEAAAEAPRTEAGDRVLKVRGFEVSPRYERRSLVYRTGENEFKADFYNQFFVAPGPMITEEAQQWLADSDLFKRVTPASSLAAPTHWLEGEIRELYGDYTDRGNPKAVMAIKFYLLENRADAATDRIIFQRAYRETVELKDGKPAALVDAMNEALRSILMRLEDDLSELNS